MALYALRALPPSESSGVDAHIGACEPCRQEVKALHVVVDAFVAWPTDVLRPNGSLWKRLAERVATESGREPLPRARSRWTEPAWRDLAPGIAGKVLASDPERARITLLVRLAPRTTFPPHRHDGVEELYLLHGELIINDRTLYAGDYVRAQPGTVDHRVWSATGCTCVLMTSLRDQML